MADNSAQEVLTKLTLDTSDWKSKVKEAKSILSDAFADDQAKSAQAQAANDKAVKSLQDQLSAYKQNQQELTKFIGVQQKQTSELEKQLAQLKQQAVQAATNAAQQAAAAKQIAAAQVQQEVAAKKAQAIWQQELVAQDRRIQKEQEYAHAQELSAIKAQALEKAAIAAAAERAAQRAKELTILKEEREQQQLLLEQQKKSAEFSHSLRGAAGTVAGSIIGSRGGIANQLIGIATAGMIGSPEAAMGVAAIEMTGEAIAKVVEKFKELTMASGPLTQLLSTFTKLSQSKGVEDSQAFLDNLRKATRNLASDTDILRTANTFLQSPVKMSQAQMIGLTSDVTNLSRARGLSTESALNALQQFFLTGRSWSLARQVGIPRQELQLTGYGPMMSEQEKMQVQANQTQAIIHQQAQQIGVPPTTFPEALRSLSTVQGRLEESFGQGLTQAGGFTQFTQWLAGIADKLSTTENAFEEFGHKVGQILGNLSEIIKSLSSSMSLMVGAFAELGKSIFDSIAKLTNTSGAEQGLTNFQSFLLQFMHTISLLAGGIKEIANNISLVANVANAIKGNDVYQNLPDNMRKAAGLPAADKRSTGQKIKEAWDKYNTNTQQTGESIDTASQSMYEDMLHSNQTNEMQEELKNNEAIKKLVQDVQKKYNKTGKGMVPVNVRENLASQISSILISSQKQRHPESNVAPSLASQVAGSYVSNIGNSSQDIPDYNLARREKEKSLKEQQELTTAYANEAFQTVKDRIQDETDLNEQMYKKGAEEAKTYYDTKKELARQTYEATKAQSIKEFGAKVTGIQGQVGIQGLTQEEANKEIQAEAVKTRDAIDAAHRQMEQAQSQADISITGNIQQKQLANIDVVLQATKTALQRETEETQNAFEEQTISAKEYLAERISLINQEVAATKEAQLKKLALKPHDTQTQDAALQAMQQAVDNAQNQLTQLKDTYTKTAFKHSQQSFEGVNSSLQARLQLSQSGNYSYGTPTDITKQMSDANQKQIQQLEELIKSADTYSTTWYQIYNAILKATDQQIQLNQQLQQSQSLLQPIGDVYKDISQQTSATFGSHFAKGLESVFSNVGQQYANVQKNVALLKGGTGNEISTDPRIQQLVSDAAAASSGLEQSTKSSASGIDSYTTQLKSAFDILQQSMANLANYINGIISGKGSPQAEAAAARQINVSTTEAVGGGLDQIPLAPVSNMPLSSSSISGSFGHNIMSALKSLDSEAGLKRMASQVTGFVNVVGSALDTITHSGSATAGAFAGFGTATAMTSTMQGMGGVMNVLGSNPFMQGGMAIAGILGGMISGQKQEQIQDDINNMEYTFKNIMSMYSSNNANLQTTVQNIQALIAEAQAEQASSKKNSSQFSQLIIQYNEQIQQLQDQAQQTLTNLQEQLVSLAAPTAYQSILQQVSSIVQQYEQFASAATTTNQLAQANTFLADSLEQLATQTATTLQQDEESAIQSALQLNQLYLDRNNLEYQYLQQVESIQGQGTITRQQTSAQSKYAQLYMASYQYSVQLDQINQQIALTQYQVSAAQQVFQLATTKAGLESQLLQLQEIGINQDMARISAMQTLLQTMAQQGYNITGGTSNANPNAQAVSILLALLQAMGLGSTASGVTNGTDAGTSSALASLLASLTALGGGVSTSTAQGQGL